MWLNHNDQTKITRAIELTIEGVTYPKQIFEDKVKLNSLNIYTAIVEAMGDTTLFNHEEVIDWTTNTLSYTQTSRTAEEIRLATVPMSITKVQGMRAMKAHGLWDAFIAAIAINLDAQDEWDLATALERNHPFVAMLAPALGLTDDQLDALFVEGAMS